MIIIGERINTISKKIASAVAAKDRTYIQQEALKQVEAGADVIDINVGASLKNEPSDMKWAVEAVQEVVEKPVCIDSSCPETIRAGLSVCRNKADTWANSILLNKKRIEGILPLVKEYKCPVVALCIDENSIPGSAQERVDIARKITDVIYDYGISQDNLYLDALIEPIAIDTTKGRLALDTVRALKKALPKAKTIICLSAVSFGLPGRRLLNRTFLTLLTEAGLDAVILDPTDKELTTTLKASNLLLNKDRDCTEYIKSFRLEKKETKE